MQIKLRLFVIAMTAYLVSATVPFFGQRSTFPRFFNFPQHQASAKDNLHQDNLHAVPNLGLMGKTIRNPANNQYILYTRRNTISGQTLVPNNTNSITSSNFNPKVSTVVISHGWLGNHLAEPNPAIRNAYLAKSDVNIISVDWIGIAALDYGSAAAGVPAVGRGLGQFLLFLNQVTGAPFNTMHLIGFSLGAHVVGIAGRELGGRAARVTGLDPAGPLWQFNSNRISSNAGVYVEAIHTDGSQNGIGFAVAHADFFPNGGIFQPGCPSNFCNHNRAWELFAASVTNDHFVARECSNSLQIMWNTCRGGSLHMGNDNLNKTGKGMYRLDTLSIYPY